MAAAILMFRKKRKIDQNSRMKTGKDAKHVAHFVNACIAHLLLRQPAEDGSGCCCDAWLGMNSSPR
jgi:hypothetical protein